MTSRHLPVRSWWRWVGLAGVLISAWVLADAADEAKAETENPADAVLVRWVDALGGAREIQELKTADIHCDITFGAGTKSIDTYIQATSSGMYRYEYKLPKVGLLIQACNGRIAWQMNDLLGFGFQSAEEHAENLGGIDFRAPIRLGSDYPGRRLLPDETIDGRPLQVLEMADRSGQRAKWYFDRSTGLRVRMEMDGPAGHAVAEYSDFRSVGEVKEPYHVVRKAGGKTLDVTMRSILYNAGEDPTLFAAPANLMEDYEAVERIFRNYADASGMAALERVKTRFTKALIEITTSNLKVQTVIFQKRPNLLLMKQEVPGMGTTWEGFNGKVGWAWSELEGYRTMQGAELQQMLGNADLEGPLRLRTQCPFRKLLPEKEENGRALTGIALATIGGPAGILYFDTKTGRLVRADSFVQAGANGQLKIVADFSDFRKVDGVTMPFVTVLTNPAIRTVMTIESIKQNVPIDEALFQPKKGD
jgi:hypothetical protein